MFTDEHRANVWDQIRQHDLRAFSKYLTPDLLVEARRRAGVALGKGPLHLGNLVWLAVASAVHTAKNFADVLTLTLKLLSDAEGFASTPLGKAQKNGKRRQTQGKRRSKRSKHDPRRQDPTQVSEEAFTKARRLMPLGYWIALIILAGQRFQAQHARLVRWKEFRLFALDGTCLDLPHWPRLVEHFGTAKNGKSAGPPQARMVMLQLPLVRLPWRYELCPVKEGERTVAERLLGHLARNDLVLMDQGFWSFGLFCQIQSQRAYFAIRKYPGIRVRTIRWLGAKDRLVRWKKPTGPRWRNSPWPDCIELRIVDYQIKGFRPSAVVTNLTDPRRISRQEWVHLATETEAGRRLHEGLYHRRWEIETTYHELKVTQGMEGSLRSRTPEGIAYEVAGHLLLYLMVRWLMVEAAQPAGLDPLELSFKHALTELIDISQTLITASPQRVAQTLLPRLLQRIASHRVPFRPGRHYPRSHDTEIKNTGKGRNPRLPHKLSKPAK